MRANVLRFPLPNPGDVGALAASITAGEIDPRQIVAVIGKTPGNGLVNDYTRGYLTQTLSLLIAEHTGETPEAVRARIPFVFSGGVEGVLSPHFTVFTVDARAEVASGGKALAIGVAFTPRLAPGDIGRQRQIDLTAEAVRLAMERAEIDDPADVHFVQIKGPAFSTDAIAAAQGALLSDNAGRLMALGRAASAFGVAKAVGEVPEGAAVEANVLSDFSVYSGIASCSGGVEVDCNEVIVVGMSAAWSGPLAIARATMDDAIDIAGVHRALAGLGMAAAPQLPEAGAKRLRAGFIKCEASRSGRVRGAAHTMLTDGDIDQQRHIRGAVGGLVAGVLGDTALFVSGGAEHQGPDGGGIVTLIAERAR